MSRPLLFVTTCALGLVAGACARETATSSAMDAKLHQYAAFRLTTDLSALTPRQRQMVPLLIDAAKEMDDVFWREAYRNRDSLLAALTDSAMHRYVEINYGPWDRLAGDAPFVPGVGPKPAGARFYPADLTKEEFTAFVDAHPDQAAALTGLYTLIRRDESGALIAIPYHVAFADQHRRAADKLRAAAALADDAGLRRYLELRAQALLTDDYRASDVAWLDMKTNTLDIVVGPIETYEDGLFGYKAAHEAFVLVKDKAWSARLARYARFLPELQRGLPVPAAYKREMPGTDAELNAYDLVYVTGEANAGAKTIAINLPNDETVQLQKGTRRLQLKNAMRAKFDSIMVPLADRMIAADQRPHVTFDAFFANTMFHEVAHGLGITQTVNGRGTVRQALKEHASAFEEEKADVLGLYMVAALRDKGALTDGSLEDNYVTFMAGILRSVRFGASDAHGRANMVTLHFLEERGAFSRDSSGTYRVEFDKMGPAVGALAQTILTLQGDGDYAQAGRLLTEWGVVSPTLQGDLDRLAAAGIPVDIVFEQGIQN
jgi:hypothetical protein